MFKLFCRWFLQQYELDTNDIGEVNVAFSKAESSTDIRINSAQSLKDEEHDQDKEDSLTSQDMMSFSWQIAQGMVRDREKQVTFSKVIEVSWRSKTSFAFTFLTKTSSCPP